MVCEREERELTLVPATCRAWLPAVIAVKTCCGEETSQYCSPSTYTPSVRVRVGVRVRVRGDPNPNPSPKTLT